MVPGDRRTQSESHSNSMAASTNNTANTPGRPSSSTVDDRRGRRGSTHIQPILAKPPSSDSLVTNNNTLIDSSSAPPLSPGVNTITSSFGEMSPRLEPSTPGREMDPNCKLTRKESYKAQRKSYRMEKKRVAEELLNSLKDPTVVVISDWLKVRGTLKSWTKLYCVLKPGLLLLYKSPKLKSSHWVGTVLLNTCQVIERPSKKDGFCFKLFHPLEQSIWAPRGPEKETIGAVVLPLPTSYLIFRAPSQAAGKCWLDALELSVKCSSLIIRSTSALPRSPALDTTTTHETQWSEADCEKHFDGHALDDPSIFEFSSRLAQHRPQRRLMSFPQPAWHSACPSPTPGSHIHQVVSQWERLLEGNATSASTPQHLFPNPPANEFENFRNVSPATSLLATSRLSADDILKRRMTIPTVHVLEYDTRCHVVTLDPLYGASASKTDLDDASQPENGVGGDNEMTASDTESEPSNKDDEKDDTIKETEYVSNENEVLGAAGEVVAELQEEQKSLIWFLLKQVRPGMDLSKVVLPTFILEPRSFLEKLADSYYHVDLLSQAVAEDDPFTRMKGVVKWYLSGFYKKPQGLKKPYNPLLGETFRCYWQHPNGSRTFYLAEQVSHHPPISGLYVTNRQDGYAISATIIAKSKFYGNSTSAILDGVAVLTMLPRGEDYTLTIPYAHCKGILMGTLSMELGGKVTISCEKTGYHTELEFKLKPFIGGSDQLNQVVGRIKLGKENLASIIGYWDGQIMITDKRTGQESIFFNPTPEVRKQRLKKYTVPLEVQREWESQKLWHRVTLAINNDDQVAATEEKTKLEEAQRERARERKIKGEEWIPKLFVQDIISGNWVYRHADLRPWDPRNDVIQYEYNYVIRTKTRHKTPIMRTGSIVSIDPQSQVPLLIPDSRSSLSVLKSSKRQLSHNHPLNEQGHESASSSEAGHTDSSQSIGKRKRSSAKIVHMVKNMEEKMQEQTEKLDGIQKSIDQIAARQRASRDRQSGIRFSKQITDTVLVIIVVFIMQFIVRIWNSLTTSKAKEL